MSSDRRRDKPVIGEDEVLDVPPVRYGGTDAILSFDAGDEIDLNAVPDPFTGEQPAAGGLSSLRAPSDKREADARVRIGRRLRALREDLHFSKKELARRAGMTPSRLTAVERGDAPLGMSLVSLIVRSMGATLSDIARPDAPEVSVRELVKIGESAGAPRPALERIGDVVGRQRFGAALVRAFRWAPEDLRAGTPRSPELGVLVAFNARPDRRPPQDSPVLALARTMSELSASLHASSFNGLPSDPNDIRTQVLERSPRSSPAHAGVTLDALLSWAWDAGVIVLPLTKAKHFGAAAWFVDDDPVIVLEESRPFGAYWLFDLAHELAHLALGHVDHRGIVDVGELSERATTTAQEQAANEFALELLLPDAKQLIGEVRRRTRNDAPRFFKFAVAGVARASDVSAGLLGFAAAREMTDVPADKDRWGSASNLARDEDPDGRARVEEAFSSRIEPARLDDLDAALLRAVSTSS